MIFFLVGDNIQQYLGDTPDSIQGSLLSDSVYLLYVMLGIKS